MHIGDWQSGFGRLTVEIDRERRQDLPITKPPDCGVSAALSDCLALSEHERETFPLIFTQSYARLRFLSLRSTLPRAGFSARQAGGLSGLRQSDGCAVGRYYGAFSGAASADGSGALASGAVAANG